MPLLQIKSFEQCIIGIWEMSESAGELLALLQPGEKGKAELDLITSPVRKKEYLAVRNLLKAMKGFLPGITHAADGKPFLSGDTQHISITHSRNLAAIILSDFPAGIDTEVTGRKVSDVARRFLSEEEMAWTLNAPQTELARLFCWSCKEAAYKMLGIPGIDFKHTLTVCPEEIREKGTSSVVFKSPGREKIIRMNYFLLANNIITWCVNI